ncbi:Norsolorinic acid ketoreductase [Lachnellula suecica]|uniref:Norsolorinic acid ketoreductase n=1 Tax=Lachnellula suecica TaxID=602035 RepID=A0A8T9CGD7_9HELO|nr:Norsolorinic acid ketoreductase [Lachnellula suecica]
MSAHQTVLVTGANRGIGRGLLSVYLSRPNTTGVAAVRDPISATSISLSSLPLGPGSKLIVVKIDSSVTTDPLAAIDFLKSEHKVTSLDIVIANAGMVEFYGDVTQTPIDGMKDHLNVNTVSVLALFQAVWPLLKEGKTPKFITVSSTVGSIGEAEKWQLKACAYGASKAALNYLTKVIHIENPGLIAFPIHPGWVQTDMGNRGATNNGLEEAPTTVQECVDGMIDKIDGATKEKTSGTFVSADGEKVIW